MDTAQLTPNELLCLLIFQALMRQHAQLKLTERQVQAIMYVIVPIIGDDHEQHSHRAR